jgi:hypothetical protein
MLSRFAVPALGVLLSCLASTVSAAQTVATQQVRRFTVVAGLNRATFRGEDVDGIESRTAFLIGAGVHVQLSRIVGFRPELLYSMKGAVSTSALSTDEAEMRMNYVELPLLLHIALPVAGGIRPFVMGGPSVGYRVGCDMKTTSAGESDTITCAEIAEILGEPELKKTDVGVHAAGGVAFDMGAREFTLGVRYNRGLSKVFADSQQKHRVLSFVVGFELPVAGR